MSNVIDIKKNITDSSVLLKNKFNEVLAIINAQDVRRKLYVNGGSEELAKYCVQLKAELSKKL